MIVDIVTSRQANLHNQMLQILDQDRPPAVLPDETSLYAVAYRPIVREDAQQVEVWPSALTLGQPLPTVPLCSTWCYACR